VRGKQARACGWLLLLISCCVCAAQSKPAHIPTGVVVPKVVTLSDAKQSYALFLPSNYSPARKWPIMYAFDPEAKGHLPVDLMKDAAEKYGYIVVGSNNSKNGPITAQSEAIKALSRDTQERFPIDERRVYTTGFSGGARVATLVALQCGCIAGVFANGAGFPQSQSPTKGIPFVFFASIGDVDFNHPELVQLGHNLDKVGAINRIREFPGPHQWAPVEVVNEAFEWFQLNAMRKVLIAKDDALITAQFDAAITKVKAAENSGDIYAAYRQYQKIIQDFNQLHDLSRIAGVGERLKKTKGFAEGRKREQDEIAEQERLTGQIMVALNSSQDSPAERHTILASIDDKWQELKHAAEDPQGTSQNRVRRRARSQILAHLYEAGQSQIAKGNYSQGIINFELVSELSPKSAAPYYEQARAYCLSGDKKKTMRALKTAVERGFSEVEALDDPAFDKMKNDDEFKKLLLGMHAKN
jgi:dienelactone hydrolase